MRKKVRSNASPVNLEELRVFARQHLSSKVFDYIDGGAGDEITMLANRNDLDDIRLLPLCLRDVSQLSMTTKVLGTNFRQPIGFSPTAFHRLVNSGGEVLTAKAAKALGIPMIVSCMSSVPLEEIARTSGNKNLWFHTYIFKDRSVTQDLIVRAENAGYKAIVVTIGCPVAGKRDRNIRNQFSLPEGLGAANFLRGDTLDHNNPIHSFRGAALDACVTWKDIDWIRSNSGLPILLKGIMSSVDVPPALDLQVAGLIVSNHGGRQLDTTESTIRALPEVVAAVARKVPLFVDSGFRRGTDLLKAFALGADVVLLGRPVLWGLAVDGKDGVVAALNILIQELELAMQLVGCSSIDELRENSAYIIRRPTDF